MGQLGVHAGNGGQIDSANAVELRTSIEAQGMTAGLFSRGWGGGQRLKRGIGFGGEGSQLPLDLSVALQDLSLQESPAFHQS